MIQNLNAKYEENSKRDKSQKPHNIPEKHEFFVHVDLFVRTYILIIKWYREINFFFYKAPSHRTD